MPLKITSIDIEAVRIVGMGNLGLPVWERCVPDEAMEFRVYEVRLLGDVLHRGEEWEGINTLKAALSVATIEANKHRVPIRYAWDAGVSSPKPRPL